MNLTLQRKKKPKFKVPFSGKSRHYQKDEIAAVVRAMKSADPQTQGRYQKEFEKKFAHAVKVPHAFAVSNATAALELAAVLSGVGPGDEVIIPAHTFCATAIPFGRTGAALIWADIDPETWVVSAESIQKLITPRTKVIVVVHLYGLTADMDSIMDLARANKIQVVEDCAQSLGALYKGSPAGSFGDFSCFSFHSHKNITTLGEGGMLCIRADEIAAQVPGLRHNGLRPYAEREHYWKPAMSLVDSDREEGWPYNFCIGEVQCALGIRLLKKIRGINAFRNKRSQKIREALKDFPEVVFQAQPKDCRPSHHLMPAKYVTPESGATRDHLIALMAYRHRVQLVVQYYPLFRYPLFQKRGFGEADCSQSEILFDSMFSLPFHEHLSEVDFNYVLNSLIRSLKELRKPDGSWKNLI